MPYRDMTYGKTLEDIRREPAPNPLVKEHAVVLDTIDALSLADASMSAIDLGFDDAVEFVLGAVDKLCMQTGIEMTRDGDRVSFCVTGGE